MKSIFLMQVKLFFSDWQRVVALFVLPIVVFHAITYFWVETIEEVKIPIAVVDHSLSLLPTLKEHSSLRVIEVEENSVRQLVLTNQVDVAVVVAEDIGARIEAGDTNGMIDIFHSNASLATPFVKEILASKVIRLISNQAAADRVVNRLERYKSSRDLSEAWITAWEYTDAQWEPVPLMTINATELRYYETEVEKESERSLPLVMLAVIMLFAFFSSDWVFQEQQVRKRFLLCGLKPMEFFLGYSLAMIVVGSLFVMILTMDLRFIPYLIACSFIGIVISTLSRSLKQSRFFHLCVVVGTSFAIGPQHLYDHFWGLIIVGVSFFFLSFSLVRWKYVTGS